MYITTVQLFWRFVPCKTWPTDTKWKFTHKVPKHWYYEILWILSIFFFFFSNLTQYFVYPKIYSEAKLLAPATVVILLTNVKCYPIHQVQISSWNFSAIVDFSRSFSSSLALRTYLTEVTRTSIRYLLRMRISTYILSS